jgi:hypothetical protein
MFRHNSLRFGLLVGACVAVALSVGVGSDGRAGQPGEPKPTVTVYSLDAPPKEIAEALRALSSPNVEKRRVAADTLARLEGAEPYLRHYWAKEDRSDGFAGEALDAIEVARAKRNMKRVPGWAKAGRYDLLVDLSLHLTTTEQADEVAQVLFDFAKAIRPIAPKLGGPEASYRLAHSMKHLTMHSHFLRFHEKARSVETDRVFATFVRAQSCAASCRVRQNWLILTRNELKGTAPISNQWEDCYIFHNSDVTFDNCVWSLAVCDGDVEFVNSVDGHSSTIIANGSVRSKTGLRFDGSCFFARGDIVAEGSSTQRGLLLAGGKIDVPRTRMSKDSKERVEKAGVKENPFGVRFFETADVGVETAMKGDALTITKLTLGSPLTKYGVQVGDVVRQLNEKAVKTANDFRRELRYSVALEAGIFHITRGDQKITRIVYFKNGLEK